MGSVILYIAAVLFAVVACGILILFVLSDIRETIRYVEATKVEAKVEEYLGEVKTANYGVRQPPTIYHKFRVMFFINGFVHRGEFLSKYKGLKEGSRVEVRYALNSNGMPEIVNRNIVDRFLRLCLVVVITAVLVILMILLDKVDDSLISTL